MSFQLIDQILSIRPGEQATGVLQPGAGAETLPLGLLVEAVGQLASWATIPELEFDQINTLFQSEYCKHLKAL